MKWAAVPAEWWTWEIVPRQVGVTTESGQTGTISTAPETIWEALATPITSMFLHGSWGHILGNMMFLLTFGDQIEDRLGHLRYLLFYILGGIGACMAHIVWSGADPTPVVGASGAISAVMGAYLLTAPLNRVTILVFFIIPVRVPAFIILGLWCYTQWGGLIRSGADNVAYMAHAAGFVLGLLMLFPLSPKKKNDHNLWNLRNISPRSPFFACQKMQCNYSVSAALILTNETNCQLEDF